MEKKNAATFMLSIVAIILGVTLYKQFDFENFRFKHPPLAVVYALTLIIAIYFLIKKPKSE